MCHSTPPVACHGCYTAVGQEAVRREIEATVQLMQQLMRELDQVIDNYISARKKEADVTIAQEEL